MTIYCGLPPWPLLTVYISPVHPFFLLHPFLSFGSTLLTQYRKAPQAKPIETIGTFDPIPKKIDSQDSIPRIKDIQLNVERFKYWISVGAQPSDTVRSLAEKVCPSSLYLFL